MAGFIKKLFTWGVVAVFLAVAILVFQLLRFQHGNISLPQQQTIFLIKSGSNIKSIAQDLSLQKVIDDPWLFILLAKLKGVETSVRAGEYQIESGLTADDLLELFTQGNSIQYSFTIIEGWSFRQLMDAISEDPVIEHTLQGKTNQEIMSLLGYPDQHPHYLAYLEGLGAKFEVCDQIYSRRPDGSDKYVLAAVQCGPEEAAVPYYLVSQAIEAIRQSAQTDQPFFIRVDFWGPHAPYIVPERYARMYDPNDIQPWPNFDDDLAARPEIQRAYKHYWGVDDFTWEEWSRLVAMCCGGGLGTGTIIERL